MFLHNLRPDHAQLRMFFKYKHGTHLQKKMNVSRPTSDNIV